MNNDIVVSVVLIVYNHEKYLRQAIEGILMQEVDFNYEIVVGDDVSTDGSRAIILEYEEKYPELFVLNFQKKNVGGTKNIYDSCMQAKGKYLAPIEGDDYWTDNKKLQKTVDFLESHHDYVGVSHLIEARDLEGNYLSSYPNASAIVGKDATPELFLKGIYFSAVATVFKNIFLNKTEDYSFIYKAHHSVGDLTICMLLLDLGKIKVLNQTMSVYRYRNVKGESNYNSIKNAIEKYNDHIHILYYLDNYFQHKYNFTDEYVRRTFDIFIYCIKGYEMKNLSIIFRKLPLKIKFAFCLYFPVLSFKWLSKKFVSKKKQSVLTENN